MAQLGDLIVTGTSRFLNKINGACTNGTTVSSQSQSTKFLREDGTWAAPSYTTNTNNAVTQTATDSTNATYELLFSSTADNTTRTEGARKTQNLTYNPSTRTLNLQYPTTAGNSGTFTIQSNSNNILGLYSGYNSGMTGVYAKNGKAGNTWIELIAGTDDLKIQSTDLAFQDSTNTWDGTNKSLKTAVTNAKGTVRQYPTDSGNYNYEILFSNGINNNDDTGLTRKTQYLTYNATYKTLTISDGTKHMSMNGSGDIILTNTTWDGTNTSLKSAIDAKANAASPTITGNMTMSNGSINMSHNASIIGLSGIELYCPSTSGNHGGYIDFHWNQNTADYTARLIEIGSKGTIKAYNSISNASDRRLKDNIVDIDDKYVGLLNIVNAKQYNFKSSEDKTDLGFIAQEVEDAMKQIGIVDDKMPIISKPTDNDVDKYYGLDYSQMTALLWKICQVQQKEIDELKNK